MCGNWHVFYMEFSRRPPVNYVEIWNNRFKIVSWYWESLIMFFFANTLLQQICTYKMPYHNQWCINGCLWVLGIAMNSCSDWWHLKVFLDLLWIGLLISDGFWNEWNSSVHVTPCQHVTCFVDQWLFTCYPLSINGVWEMSTGLIILGMRQDSQHSEDSIFSCIFILKMVVFRFSFLWSLFLQVKWTIISQLLFWALSLDGLLLC